MQEIKVKNVIFTTVGQRKSENYEKFVNVVREKKIRILEIKAGDKVNIEKDLYFNILWPIEDEKIEKNEINNNSIICKLFYKDFSMLFTGDIEGETEKLLYSKYYGTDILKSTILKVAHHGSKTSSTEEFLNCVKPKIALIGLGKNNNFGHPNTEVLERLENLRSRNI